MHFGDGPRSYPFTEDIKQLVLDTIQGRDLPYGKEHVNVKLLYTLNQFNGPLYVKSNADLEDDISHHSYATKRNGDDIVNRVFYDK